jgi:hypothetical protein
MKQLFLCLFSIGIIMSSCSKDHTDSTITSGPSNVPQSYTLNVNASHWTDNQDGTFTCTFKNILNYSSNSYVTAFLRHDGQETEITNSGISYMGGSLKSKFSGKDLSLTYSLVDGNRELPFTSLDIKVVFQP